VGSLKYEIISVI